MLRRSWRWLVLGIVTCGLIACFGGAAKQRSYYVLHGVTVSQPGGAPLKGLVRVRDLNAESIYEKFQIVVRKSPFQLTYSEDDVWAVKPNRMVSDVIARALADAKRFSAVARELGELRPDFILSGDLRAIEVYDSGDLWYAHLSLALNLSRYDNGEVYYRFTFDERKPIPGRNFSQAARAQSELLSTALDEFIRGLVKLGEEGSAPDAAGPQNTQRAPSPRLEASEAISDDSEKEVDSELESDSTEGDTLFVPQER